METIKPFELKYCRTCVMPNSRPYIHFHEDGECSACKNFKKQEATDWDARWKQLEELADKYRGCNGNGYDCAVACSGGKDSHVILDVIKNKLGLNPVVLSLGNVDWSPVGRENIYNLSSSFSVDIISMQPNIDLCKRLFKADFISSGKPSSYWDVSAYGWTFRMASKLGIKMLVWGESVSFSYGGIDDEETPSGKNMAANKVATPEFEKWISEGLVTAQEVESARLMTLDECNEVGLEPIYLQYYLGWDSIKHEKIARRLGFRNLKNNPFEGTIENFNQIDDIGYRITQFLKFPKYMHSSVTDLGSRMIRGGYATRNEIIELVKKHDGILDQDVAKHFMDFIGMKPREFWAVMDKWYNKDFFYQDRQGIWHPKFEVGVGMKPEWK